MNRSLTHTPKRLFLAAALMGLGTVALAQQGQPPAPEPAPTASSAQPAAANRAGTSSERWRERMEQHQAQRMAQLKASLKITPEQEGAWSQFESAMQPPPPPERPNPDEWTKLTTPERIDRIEQRSAEHQQHMKQFGDAVKAFYAQLTPDQQKTFDASAMPFGAPPMMGKNHGPRRGPGKPPKRHHHPAPKPAADSQAN